MQVMANLWKKLFSEGFPLSRIENVTHTNNWISLSKRYREISCLKYALCEPPICLWIRYREISCLTNFIWLNDKNPKRKTDLEWSAQPIQHKKFQVDNDREYMGQSNMPKENIINLIFFNQYCQPQVGRHTFHYKKTYTVRLSQALSGSLSCSSLA